MLSEWSKIRPIRMATISHTPERIKGDKLCNNNWSVARFLRKEQNIESICPCQYGEHLSHLAERWVICGQ